MSEYINNVSRRKAILKDVLRQLHEGRPVEQVTEEFGALAKEATSEEIAEVEQMLIDEGLPVEEIQRLCDVHVAVFREGLDTQVPPETVPGHPLHTFRAENTVILKYLEETGKTVEKYRQTGLAALLETIRLQIQRLSEIDRHYRRKEYLLFPYLERYGFQGPSKVMWGIHDDIRDGLKELEERIGRGDDSSGVERSYLLVAENIKEMAYKEEEILFPTALKLMKHEDWAAVHSQEDEIGYFLVVPGTEWTVDRYHAGIHSAASAGLEPGLALDQTAAQGHLALDTGLLTLKQINLMLTHLPVDITYVDEKDEVRFFSQTRERIFERPATIIGRKVQNCHPPQSIGRVQRILDDFRAGSREAAEFWIQMAGKFIHIRYYPVRDEAGAYCGCIEVSQDVTTIRALEGERRLLDD